MSKYSPSPTTKEFKYRESAKPSKPALEPDQESSDWDAKSKELAETSSATSRFSGYKGIRPDENKLNHENYSLAQGYEDGSDSSAPARANHLLHEGSAARSQNDEAQASLDKSTGGKPSRGKPAKTRTFRVGSVPTEVSASDLYPK